MENIVQFIKSLGNLHDAKVLELLWLPSERRLEIEIADLYSNFHGLPEYRGPARGRFVFSQVSTFYPEVNFTEVGLMIYDWKFKETDAPYWICEIRFSPSGKIVIECGHIECRYA